MMDEDDQFKCSTCREWFHTACVAWDINHCEQERVSKLDAVLATQTLWHAGSS